jgi:hypothetical protein
MSVIPFRVFSWSPPELSAPERIALGAAIAIVGRDAFLNAYKGRLTGKPFTFADVLVEVAVPLPGDTRWQKSVAGGRNLDRWVQELVDEYTSLKAFAAGQSE